MRIPPIRVLVGMAALALLITVGVVGHDVLSITFLQSQQKMLQAFVADQYILALMLYGLFYLVSAATTIPFGGILILLAGFLFGFVPGVLVSVIPATLGAVLIFLLAEYVFRDWILSHWGEKLAPLEREVLQHPASYLLFLRIMPITPHAVVNIVPALVRIPLPTFLWTTVIGFLPGAIILSYAGNELERITSTGQVIAPSFIIAIVLLSLLSLTPLVYKKVERRIRKL